jgi:hypothetical protein
MKFEFSRDIFEEYSNITFPENPPSGNRVVPCGQPDRQTDRHDKINFSSTIAAGLVT